MSPPAAPAAPAAPPPPAAAAPPPPPPAAKPPKPPLLEPVRRLPSRRKTRAAAPAVPARPAATPSASGPAGLDGDGEGGAGARRVRPFINLCGDYRFLRAGYWALVDAELNGVESSPTPIQAVTAQNAAACLLVATHSGIATVDWKVARRPQDVEPPSLLVPVAGLTDTVYEVKSTRSRAAQWRSATQNGTRTALAVRLPGDLRSMNMIVGVTTHENYQLAWEVWRTFGVPLATIWYVEAGDPDGPEGSVPLFLGLDPLPLHELTERELRLYEDVSQRPMEA